MANFSTFLRNQTEFWPVVKHSTQIFNLLSLIISLGFIIVIVEFLIFQFENLSGGNFDIFRTECL